MGVRDRRLWEYGVQWRRRLSPLVEPHRWLRGMQQGGLALWAARPRGVAHWLSVLLLLSVFGAYLSTWLQGYWTYLTDSTLQHDDVRTALFPFHRYGPEQALADDPIALEMLAYIPLFVKAVFAAAVPWVGLSAACKVSQALCLLIVGLAGALLIGRRRAGLAGGLLLIFLFFRDDYVLERIASGLPRSYGFPALALWVAGALAGRVAIRRAALVLAALTYPSALAMALSAEGLLVARGVFARSPQHIKSAARSLAVSLALSVAAVSPALFAGRPEDGRVHTLQEAKAEPAFGRAGRLYILPFADSRQVFGVHFTKTFTQSGQSPWPELRRAVRSQGPAVATAVVALLVVLPLVGLTPVPYPAIVFFAGNALVYLVARAWAFRLYSPERYYSYGMRAAGLLLLLNVAIGLGYRFRSRSRYVVRNVAAACVMLGLWFSFGDGVKPNTGLTISTRQSAPLYDFIRGLPSDVRIASHLSDADNIPFFSGRATMGGYETLQPWLKGSWARQKARAEDTLRALYATDRQTVLDYAERNGVTHLLLNKNRYRNTFRGKARSFQPLSDFTDKLLKPLKLRQLVLARPPKSAVVFSYRHVRLVSVERLRRAWGGGPAKASEPGPESTLKPTSP